MTEFLTFRAADELWAVPLADVNEVVAVSSLTHVPLTPKCVAGVFDLHGATVTAIDFAVVAGATNALRASAIVLGDFALLVDAIYDVVDGDMREGTSESRPAWSDGVAASATVVNPARLLEAIQ